MTLSEAKEIIDVDFLLWIGTKSRPDQSATRIIVPPLSPKKRTLK
jgi:hypothetical protein